jgi:hypothetical protein
MSLAKLVPSVCACSWRSNPFTNVLPQPFHSRKFVVDSACFCRHWHCHDGSCRGCRRRCRCRHCVDVVVVLMDPWSRLSSQWTGVIAVESADYVFVVVWPFVSRHPSFIHMPGSLAGVMNGRHSIHSPQALVVAPRNLMTHALPTPTVPVKLPPSLHHAASIEMAMSSSR